MILHVLIAMLAGWIQRHQQQVVAYLLAENRILNAQLGGRRLRLTDTERRRLAALTPLAAKASKKSPRSLCPTPFHLMSISHLTFSRKVLYFFVSMDYDGYDGGHDLARTPQDLWHSSPQ